jgi:spermidine/putrescine transport system permease protein
MRRSSAIWLPITAAFLYIFLWAPIVVVVVFSFNIARFGAGWAGFTPNWYATLWENALALSACKNTLLLAGVSTLASTILGTLLAYGLERFEFPAKRAFERLLLLPVFIPDIIMAISLVLIFSLLRKALALFEPGLVTMIIGHITFQIPFVAIIVRARLAGADPVLEEAAHDLGANERQTFAHVTLPLMMPGIIAGAMLAFTLSLDDFVVSFFTSGPGSMTLPILIYSSVKRGITPDINALSTLIIAVSMATTILITGLQRARKA